MAREKERERVADGIRAKNAAFGRQVPAKARETSGQALRVTPEPPASPVVVVTAAVVEVRVVVPFPTSPTARVWRTQCHQRHGETGRRCCLLEGHLGAHRDCRGVFTSLAMPEQTHFPQREALDIAARAQPGAWEDMGLGGHSDMRSDAQVRAAKQGRPKGLRGERCLENAEGSGERAKAKRAAQKAGTP